MIDLYFTCCDCKIFIDAGHRWAYWELEATGIVTRKEKVDVDAVLAAERYWNPPVKDESSFLPEGSPPLRELLRDYWNPPPDYDSTAWLREGVFPPLREFLRDHKDHQIEFGSKDDFLPSDEDYFDFDWMQIGYLLMPTPRYLVEVMNLTSWAEVREYMEKQEWCPAWWDVTWDGIHDRARQKFEELVSHKKEQKPQKNV